jgi:hypothetical protein
VEDASRSGGERHETSAQVEDEEKGVNHLTQGGFYSNEQVALIEQHVDEKFIPGVQTYVRYRYCNKCKQVKPPRSHHCSICGRCVMRMDHHCPWVGNCVGFRTHKYFWNFLLYSFLGTANAAINMIAFKGLSTMQEDVMYMIAAVLSTAFSIAISFLLGIHTYMLLNNMTTLEMGALSLRNPFDQGNWRNNWAQTFGTDSKTWFLPVPPRDQGFDGFNSRVQPNFLPEDL